MRKINWRKHNTQTLLPTYLSSTASVSERRSCIIATISSLLDLDAMIRSCNSLLRSHSRSNSSSRIRTSARSLTRSSASFLYADADPGRLDSSQVMAFGLVLSVTFLEVGRKPGEEEAP
jgi:hypothetical protein